jgi:hypothetical protein
VIYAIHHLYILWFMQIMVFICFLLLVLIYH